VNSKTDQESSSLAVLGVGTPEDIASSEFRMMFYGQLKMRGRFSEDHEMSAAGDYLAVLELDARIETDMRRSRPAGNFEGCGT
jgi:hypothetical protein